MRIQSVNAINYSRQAKKQNFTSVKLFGTEISETSDTRIRALLKDMDPRLQQNPQTALDALKRLVMLDKICNPDDIFKVSINGGGDSFKIFAAPNRITQPSSACDVDVLPIDTLGNRLTDAYIVLKAEFIPTGGEEGIYKFSNLV